MSQAIGEVPDLACQLRGMLGQIPRGRVATYGSLADALGNRIAARWVGHFAMHHDHGRHCPCHRVVRAGGQLGQYITGSVSQKARRLKAEGVEVRHARVDEHCVDEHCVDLERFGFDRFVCDRPLERLGRVQEELLARVSIRPRRRVPRLIGGVDVSYVNAAEGVAGYALVDRHSGRLVWSTTVRRRILFPYVSTYLTFRELPILLDLIEEVRAAGRMSEVLLVDGSGILHPRGAGIATHLGVVAAVPTIGVTKKLLCGQVDLDAMASGESRPMVHADRLAGVALRPTAGSRRPIFISPGHRADVAFSETVVRSLLAGRRLPAPLYWAARLSRVAARGE